jgi:hypothetical protein
MDTSPTQGPEVPGWRCEACEARVASSVTPGECPLCGGSLAADGIVDEHRCGLVMRPRHDRVAFARAALAFLATSVAVPDEVVASLEVPANLVPLYMPFRRVQGAYQARSAGGEHVDVVRGTFQVDVCLAPGLEAREAAALEEFVTGYSVEEFGAAPPAGVVLLGQIPRSRVSGRAERRLGAQLGPGLSAHAIEVSGEHDYLVPVWVLTVLCPGRPLRLLMEAGSGRFVGPAPPTAASGRSLAQLDVLAHWAWLPALFCLLLAALIDTTVVRGALCALAVATLLGSYLAAAELRRVLARTRSRLAAALSGDTSAGDPAPARRRLVAMQRAVASLPAIYAAIAVCAHLGVTAYVAERSAAQRAPSPEAASLVPWSPANANLRTSPFALVGVAGAHRASPVEAAAVLSMPRPRPATGRVISVGHGAYQDLAAAVAAASSGDTIRIEAGRYEGSRIQIDKDLAIEGRGDVAFVWRGGRGPFIRIGGRGTQVSFTHLRFEAYDINTAVLGDPNEAYGEPPSGSGQVVRLRDVSIESPQASAIYSTSPGARYLVEGGRYTGAGSAIIVIDAAELVIRPYRGAPTRIATAGTSGVAHNAVGLTVHGTRRLTIDNVQWSGNPGGDIAIQGDAVAVNVGRAAEAGAAQRVLLVDDRGAAQREIAASDDDAPLRFSVHAGELRPLPAGDVLQ